MTTTPPDGYTVPQVVTDLIEFAKINGWKAIVQWSTPEYTEPHMTVCVGRTVAPQDGYRRGPWWQYKFLYHSRGCNPGEVKKLGPGKHQTPDHPQWRNSPSIYRVRQVIYGNPEPGTVTVQKGPITRDEFNGTPRARVLRFSYDWMNRRYTEWIEDLPEWGWSLMNDYGRPESPCMVSRADSRAMAAEHLTEFLAPNRAYGGDNLTVDEWEIGP